MTHFEDDALRILRDGLPHVWARPIYFEDDALRILQVG